MKKLFALLLALLLVSSVVLTACTTDNTESSTKGDETTTKGDNESESESESETGSDLPILNGDVYHFTLNITNEEGETLVAEAEWNNLEKTLILTGTAGDETLSVVYRDDLYYVKAPGEEHYTVMTQDAILDLLEGEMEAVDPTLAEFYETLLEALKTGNFEGIELPDTSFDLDAILSRLPEEYRGVAEKIRDLFPEEITFPEFELPALPQIPEDPEEMIASLLALFDKTEGEDGGLVYTLDLAESLAAIKQILATVPGIFEMTPAALIDSFGGEGTYENAFLMITGSITGDTTVGEILDFLVGALNAQGFRITDEKLVSLIAEISRLTGNDADEETIATYFASLREMTLDTVLANFGADITVAELWETVNEMMTGSTLAELLDGISEGTSEQILAAIEQISAALDTVICSVQLTTDGEGIFKDATFVFAVGDKISVNLAMTVSDDPVMTYPEDLPALSDVTVTENEDGDVVISGLPEGATVSVSLPIETFLYIASPVGPDPVNESWSKYVDIDGLCTQDGTTVTVAAELWGVPERVIGELSEMYGDDLMYSYQYIAIVQITLADGTVFVPAGCCEAGNSLFPVLG